jgi:regulator of nucleoside diphosphate kinase
MLSRADRNRLQEFIALHEAQLAEQREALARLSARLQSVRVMDVDDVPEDMVTMYSQIRLRDLDTQRSFIMTVALPESKDTALLTRAYPFEALLGARVGEDIVWGRLGRQHRVRVEEILFQPESSARQVRARRPKKRSQVPDVRAHNRYVSRGAESARARSIEA